MSVVQCWRLTRIYAVIREDDLHRRVSAVFLHSSEDPDSRNTYGQVVYIEFHVCGRTTRIALKRQKANRNSQRVDFVSEHVTAGKDFSKLSRRS